MDFQEYQKRAGALEKRWRPEDDLIYATLSVVGEAGEVAEKIKKVIRDDQGVVSEEKKVEIAKEMGDTLWGLACLCNVLNLRLEEVAIANILKLESREQRGVLSGSGDNR